MALLGGGEAERGGNGGGEGGLGFGGRGVAVQLIKAGGELLAVNRRRRLASPSLYGDREEDGEGGGGRRRLAPNRYGPGVGRPSWEEGEVDSGQGVKTAQ
jgi:hypothetical protein